MYIYLFISLQNTNSAALAAGPYPLFTLKGANFVFIRLNVIYTSYNDAVEHY